MRWRQDVEARRGSSAFTMVEAAVFTFILTMGVLALISTSLTVHHLRRLSDERSAARTGLESMIEEIQRNSVVLARAGPGWGEAFAATYGPGGSFGDRFAVAGLDPQAGRPTVGSIQVVTDETMTDIELGTRLGLPLDLDNDGSVDDTDVRATAEMFPVIVRVAWSGVSGDQEMSQELLVLSY